MRDWKRALAAVLAAALLTGSVFAAEAPKKSSLKLGEDLTLETGAVVDGEDTVREQVLTFDPTGVKLMPMVAYGNTLYGRSTMDYIEAYLEEQDLHVAAGINGAFFDFSTGIPYGLVVTDDILRSSGSTNAIGIGSDGEMWIGDPQLEVKLSWSGGETVINYNKALSKTNGFCLYSRDYDTKTRHSISACNLVLQAERTALHVSDSLTAKVVAIEKDTKDCSIPENGFVLSLATETAYASAMEQMTAIAVGDTLTVTVTVDQAWENVSYAVGGGELLVENGRVQSGFTLDSADKQAARTALGLTSRGEVICYTVDKGELSDGMTLSQLAQRMKELGCVTAINLDGGGSTTLGVTLPGLTEFTTVNQPSDGSQRSCANFLFFVSTAMQAGTAVRLHVYPYDAVVLRGGQVELTVAATDSNYLAAEVPAGVSLSATGGTISGNVFTAQKVGTATVSASGGGLTGTTSIHVVETPTAMTVRREDQTAALEKLIVESGESVDLTVDAEYLGLPLEAEDYAFTWYVPSELGRIGDDGVFTASENNVTGDLMVSCGDLRVTVPVEIKANPFADTKGHWARSYITDLYYRGVLQGAQASDGKMYYRPDDSMTRQEFVVAMMRAQDIDLSKYADVELPFADAGQIASWAQDAMKAAYKLGWFTGSGKGGKLYAEPNDTITREAAMTILARTISAQSDSDALESFSDAGKVSDWAKSALTAMVEREIINGMNGQLQPQGSVTRAQVAKMLYAME